MKHAVAGALVLALIGVPAALTAQTREPAANVAPQSGVESFDAAKSAYERGDYDTAFPSMKKLAEAGNAKAQFYLGEMYNGGLGTGKDTAVAIEWYRRSAEQGDIDGIQALGQGMRLMLER